MRMLAELPVADHVGDGVGEPEFKICAWRLNDSKGQLSLPEFLELCRQVLEFHGYEVGS